MIERQAVAERGLAEQQHGARVAGCVPSTSPIAARPAASVDRSPRSAAIAGDEIALVDGVENLDRAHDLESAASRAVGAGSGGGRTAMSLRPSRARAIWP